MRFDLTDSSIFCCYFLPFPLLSADKLWCSFQNHTCTLIWLFIHWWCQDKSTTPPWREGLVNCIPTFWKYESTISSSTIKKFFCRISRNLKTGFLMFLFLYFESSVCLTSQKNIFPSVHKCCKLNLKNLQIFYFGKTDWHWKEFAQLLNDCNFAVTVI